MQAIEADSSYYPPYNNLAYMQIDHEINPERGVELVRQAMELEPNNSYILDTYGWGLYKLGQYVEALDVLKQAWELNVFAGYDDRLHLEAARKAVAEQ